MHHAGASMSDRGVIGLVARASRSAPAHWLIILVVCALVYWPRLGVEGLRSTEGHRAIPGWEALETGRWMPTTMFEAVYVRKPPGMPWAIAAASSFFGETEFAARLPSAASATAMALVAFVFASRWFGRPWGLAAGLGQALMPRFWSPGRTADIEALLCVGVQIAAFAMIHVLVHRKSTTTRHAWGWAMVGAVGLVIALLAKAHAGLPVVAGVLIGACIVKRSAAPLANPAAWGAVLLALLAVSPVAWAQLHAMRSEAAVSEDFSKFLWDGGRFVKWLIMPFAAWGSGLPASLAVLFPWGRDARRECEGAPTDLRPRMFGVARCLALGFVMAVGVYALAGVTNERYVMPALALLPPLVAYAGRGCAEFFTPKRARIARWMMLGAPAALPALLLAGAGVFIARLEPHDARSSAREPGLSLASSLPDGCVLWADAWVNAKPELLWYASKRASSEGRDVRPIWKRREIAAAVLPEIGTMLLLKDGEIERYRAAGHAGRLELITQGAADGTPFSLFLVRP
ncbi:MAG: glycosyltransferase family 39 protein [Phycisphaerae bacterium]|nr:glycosyltransferase family 39 protein [Phycisphaerae bacterium]